MASRGPAPRGASMVRPLRPAARGWPSVGASGPAGGHRARGRPLASALSRRSPGLGAGRPARSRRLSSEPPAVPSRSSPMSRGHGALRSCGGGDSVRGARPQRSAPAQRRDAACTRGGWREPPGAEQPRSLESPSGRPACGEPVSLLGRRGLEQETELGGGSERGRSRAGGGTGGGCPRGAAANQ